MKMRKGNVVAAKVLVVAVVGFVGLAFATPTISDLKVTAIEPVGLAIDYTVSGATKIDDGRQLEISLVVTNSAQTISGETNCVNGAHRVYWNMAKDGISVEKGKAVISVRYKSPLYCVIDLSGGTNATSFAVSYRDTPPEGGFNGAAYKTTNLVLRCCSAGAEPLGRYSLTKDFYAGLFEVTQKQWELVMGTKKDWNSAKGVGDTHPVYYISYDDIRGSLMGTNWPASSEVDADSFMGVLRAKTGLKELDLPTEAQWEYACRAGTTTKYNTGDSESDLDSAGWYLGNADSMTHSVGGKLPNVWGLYDMHGNLWEWCLDWKDGVLAGNDPVGETSGSGRCIRGGSWAYDAESAASAYRNYCSPSCTKNGHSFRIFMTVK